MRRTVRFAFRDLAVLLPASVLSFTGCSGSDSQQAKHATGGTVVISTPADASTLMPLLAQNTTDRTVSDLLYDRLAEIGDDLNTIGDHSFKPQLADSWTWSPDSLSIAFHVNPRARWHDGVPVRAEDVRYSFELARSSEVSALSPLVAANLDPVTVRDSLTAVVTVKRRTPEQFFEIVYEVPIVPAHLLASTSAKAMHTADVARRGIGSGRFRLAAWEPGVRLELIADTANYRGRPTLDRVVFSIAPDFQAAATKFSAGEADVFEHLTPPMLAHLKDDHERRAVAAPDLSYAYLAFNLKDPKEHVRPHPIFADVAVRRALTMAVDRRAMVTNVFGSAARVAFGPFSSRAPLADTSITQIAYDTIASRALLDSAGWRVGPDGIRVKAGRRLAFGITTPNSSAARRQYAVLLQAAFARVGADVRVDEMDFPAYVAATHERAYDAQLTVFVPDASIASARLSWTSAGKAGRSDQNLTGYSDVATTAQFDSAATTFDRVIARRHVSAAYRLVVNAAPGIWLFEPITYMGVHSRIETTPMRADGWWNGLASWSIRPSARIPRDEIGLRPAGAQTGR